MCTLSGLQLYHHIPKFTDRRENAKIKHITKYIIRTPKYGDPCLKHICRRKKVYAQCRHIQKFGVSIQYHLIEKKKIQTKIRAGKTKKHKIVTTG